MSKVVIIIFSIIMFNNSKVISQNWNIKMKDINHLKVECPFNDKNLSETKIKELIAHFYPERKNIIKIEIHKLNNIEDWVIVYQHNIPKYMQTNRIITYVFKKDNSCYLIDKMVFYRDYLGGGLYGEIHTGYNNETIQQIDCTQ